MIPYTTATIPLTVEGLDISSYDIYVTIVQGPVTITKSGDDLTVSAEAVGEGYNTNISLELDQDETAMFLPEANADVIVNWIDDEGKRHGTDINSIRVERNLLNEVIDNGEN